MDSEGFKIPPIPGKILHPPENKPENNSVSESENRKRSREEADNPEPKKKKGNAFKQVKVLLAKTKPFLADSAKCIIFLINIFFYEIKCLDHQKYFCYKPQCLF